MRAYGVRMGDVYVHVRGTGYFGNCSESGFTRKLVGNIKGSTISRKIILGFTTLFQLFGPHSTQYVT